MTEATEPEVCNILVLQSTPLIADTLGPLHLSFIEGMSLIEGVFSIAGAFSWCLELCPL